MRAAALALLVASLLCGCGGDDVTTAPGAGGVELTYHRSGGIAAVDETLRIHRSGSASIAEGRLPGKGDASISEVSKFELSPTERTRLRGALAKSGFADLHLDGTSGCADCFVYELATPQNQVRFDQATVPTRLKQVLAELDAIVADHRPGG
jgi:hypothetical protein